MKNMANDKTAVEMLLHAGFDKKLGYYEKCGVNLEDVNAARLLIIFNDLDHIDHLPALEFVDMVNAMPTLGAKEFIINFVKFARNEFSLSGLKLVNGYNKNEGMKTMFDLVEDKDSDLNKAEITRSIKKDFIASVGPYYNQTKGLYSIKNMERKVGYPRDIR